MQDFFHPQYFEGIHVISWDGVACGFSGICQYNLMGLSNVGNHDKDWGLTMKNKNMDETSRIGI